MNKHNRPPLSFILVVLTMVSMAGFMVYVSLGDPLIVITCIGDCWDD